MRLRHTQVVGGTKTTLGDRRACWGQVEVPSELEKPQPCSASFELCATHSASAPHPSPKMPSNLCNSLCHARGKSTGAHSSETHAWVSDLRPFRAVAPSAVCVRPRAWRGGE
eukprot:2265184-Rhodomonas_salina.1